MQGWFKYKWVKKNCLFSRFILRYTLIVFRFDKFYLKIKIHTHICQNKIEANWNRYNKRF